MIRYVDTAAALSFRGARWDAMVPKRAVGNTAKSARCTANFSRGLEPVKQINSPIMES